jgi:hypothetical protein
LQSSNAILVLEIPSPHCPSKRHELKSFEPPTTTTSSASLCDIDDDDVGPAAAMAAEAFQTKTMKRKNIRNLALNAPQRSAAPSSEDAQIPGGIANNQDRSDTLEIGVEFRLDLRSEDLIVVKELGAGNGGTVSKVQHAATKVVMARKVSPRTRVSIMPQQLADILPLDHTR